jgi:hypothetical protein
MVEMRINYLQGLIIILILLTIKVLYDWFIVSNSAEGFTEGEDEDEEKKEPPRIIPPNTLSGYCSQPKDLEGYTQVRKGVCADVVGRGSRHDYCRLVRRGTEEFLACDIGSKGGYSYWFRSPLVSENYNPGELLYFRDINESGFESACRVIYDKNEGLARVMCNSPQGIGFTHVDVPDPEPPTSVRARMVGYENCLFWFRLTGKREDDTDWIHKYTMRFNNIEKRPDELGLTSERFLLWNGRDSSVEILESLPLQQMSTFYMIFKMDSGGSDQVLFYSGVGNGLDEFTVYTANDGLNIGFEITSGSTTLIQLIGGQLIKFNEWNTLAIRHDKGEWEIILNGGGGQKYAGSHINTVRRPNTIIGRLPPRHPKTLKPFSGQIADIRGYSYPIPNETLEMFEKDILEYNYWG